MLECQDVGLRIRGADILRNVSFTLRPGRMLAVVGPNGAGKSSILRILAGLAAPTSGRVSVLRRPLDAWSKLQLARRRAVLAQQSELAFDFTVRDVVLMGRHPHHGGRPRQRDHAIADEALREVDAGGLAARRFLTLSGGERQRVHLARVLAQIWDPPQPGDDPSSPAEGRALLLDEPVNHLDPRHQWCTLRLARTFADAGVAVLAVLHDLNLAAAFADDIALLERGRLRCLGSPSDVFTAETLGEVFDMPVRIDHEADGRPRVVWAPPCASPCVAPSAPHAVAAEAGEQTSGDRHASFGWTCSDRSAGPLDDSPRGPLQQEGARRA